MKRLFPGLCILLLITACAGNPPTPTVTAYLSSQMVDSTTTAAYVGGATMDAANVGDNIAETVGGALTVPQQNAIPQGQRATVWQAATGAVRLTSTANNNAVASITAQKLVANAVYSVWWIRPGEAEPQDFVPVAGTSGNIMRTDAQGNGTIQFDMPDNSEYYTYSLALIYHADNQAPANGLTELGTNAFMHLIGSGPGVSLQPSEATIMATDASVPAADITLEPATLQPTLEATTEAG